MEAVFAAVPDVPDKRSVGGRAGSALERNDLGASPPVISAAWDWSEASRMRSVAKRTTRPRKRPPPEGNGAGRLRFGSPRAAERHTIPSGSAKSSNARQSVGHVALLGRKVHVEVQLRRPAMAEEAGDGNLEDCCVNARTDRWAVSLGLCRPRPHCGRGRRGRSIGWGRRNRAPGGRWGIVRRRSSSSDQGRKGL